MRCLGINEVITWRLHQQQKTEVTYRSRTGHVRCLAEFSLAVGRKGKKDVRGLIIKYAKDLLSDPEKWCNRKMRHKAKETAKQQEELTAHQKNLLDSGVTPVEVVAIESRNRVQQVVEYCQKPHNGSINDEAELDALLLNCTCARNQVPQVYHAEHQGWKSFI